MQFFHNKIIYINEHIAGAKMAVGRYQMSQENYVGAIKNFQEVAQRYSYTNQAPEAFYRLVELYHKVGMKKESYKTFKQLSIRFPASEWRELAQELFKEESDSFDE